MLKFMFAAACCWVLTTVSGLAAQLLGVSATTGDVYRIDTEAPGSPTKLFSLGAGKDFAGLTFSPTRKTFFAFSRGENKIYEFNKSGAILSVTTPDRVLTPTPGSPRGIVADNRGQYFVVGPENRVYQLGLARGKTTFRFQAVGSTSQLESIAPLDNFAFLAVGVRSQVFLLDRTSGELTRLATLAVGDLDAMTGLIGGTIYMTESGSDSQLHAYNPFTQTFQNLGWTNIPHLSSIEEFPSNAK